MKFIADLHLHSKYSRATSKNLDIKNLEKWARVKGLNLLGTGDFTHPLWLKELKENLKGNGNGFFQSAGGMNFILQSELSLIYSQGGKGRRVHNIMLAPDFKTVDEINKYLLTKGRLDYDGRPIFKITCPELVENLRKISDKIEVIPAHCLIPDSFIHAKSELKKIKDITKNDSVLTHKGNYKKVEDILKRKFSGEIIKIIPACLKIGTYFTPEHPVYSIKSYKSCKNMPHTICKPTCAYLGRGCKIKEFQNYAVSWNQIKDLEKGDIILYPRYNRIKDINFLYLDEIVSETFKDESRIKPRNARIGTKNIPIKNKIEISKDFCRLIGYYLAEGYVTIDCIGFTFSEKETEYIEDVKNLLTQVFGANIKINIINEKSRGKTILVFSKILKNFFKIFYSKMPCRSFNKCLPLWFIDLPPDKLKEILIGWWRGDAGYTSSSNLCNQLKLIFIKLGIIPSINVTSAENINLRRKTKINMIGDRKITAKNDSFNFHNLSFFEDYFGLSRLPEFKRFITKLRRRKGWMDKNYIYLPIIDIKRQKYEGEVYNLEVKDDNSYLTENLAVHNCWTPWFALFGSMSGFDSVEEAFQDQTKYIHALETGLSSDPAMNWRLSKLDRFSLVSFSDSHSFWPWRIGREATIFDIEPSYDSLIKALRTKKGFEMTIEVDPNYGKYHLDGHRLCKVRLEPEETKKLNNICPVCGKQLTIGVLSRVEQLADRPLGFKPEGAVPFKSLIPVSEIISGLKGYPVAGKKTWEEFNKLIERFGNEIAVMLDAGHEEIKRLTDEKIADAVIANREGKVKIEPGYDGEYGYPVFGSKNIKKPEPAKIKKLQKSLSDF